MGLWRDRAFVVFWSARTLSYLGTGITNVILPLLVYQRTGSPLAVALVSGTEAVPYLAVGLLAGAIADRLNRRKIMVTCDVSCALLLGSGPAAAALHLLTTVQVFAIAVGVNTAFVWFDAANFGALPALVDRAQLPNATSLVGSGGTVAFLLGPTVGAAATGIMAPSYVLGLDGATYAMSALLLSSIRRPFQRSVPPATERKRLRADIADGLRFLWGEPVLRTMTFAVFGLCVSWGGAFGLLVVYASRALHLAHLDVRLGVLYSAGELGSVISIAVFPRLFKHLAAGWLAAAFLALNAATVGLLAVAPAYVWALPAFCCCELSYIMVTTTSITVRQMLTPDHLQSRVNTVGRMFAWGGQPIGALVGGVLAGMLSIRVAFGLMAIGAVCGAGLLIWSCRKAGSLAAVSLAASGT
jgi:MFS family permease